MLEELRVATGPSELEDLLDSESVVAALVVVLAVAVALVVEYLEVLLSCPTSVISATGSSSTKASSSFRLSTPFS